jgi:hypothetical protein
MIRPNTHSTRPITAELQPPEQAPKAILYTLHRPLTDGRFSSLIPSLLARSGFTTTPQPLADALGTLLPSPTPLASKPDYHVPNTHSKGLQATIGAQVKGALAYANSIDLQILTISNQIIFGQRTWLDLLENDITNTHANKRRSGLHLRVRLVLLRFLQKLLPWNNLVTLAEECFYNEIKFGKASPLLLAHELAVLPHVEHFKLTQHKVVLVTGTLGRHYGTLDALPWSAEHQVAFPHTLRIVGHAPEAAFAQELQAACRAYPYIELTLFDTYRPQEEILAHMGQAHFVLFPYHISPATQNRIPTKFPEAAHMGCTFILPQNPAWERWCRSRAIPFRFMDTPEVEASYVRDNLPSNWVAQRLLLQENAVLAALSSLNPSL